MAVLSQKDISFIEENIENADELLKEKNITNILDAIDKFMCINGFDDNYDLTDLGRTAQSVYDNIYHNN